MVLLPAMPQSQEPIISKRCFLAVRGNWQKIVTPRWLRMSRRCEASRRRICQSIDSNNARNTQPCAQHPRSNPISLLNSKTVHELPNTHELKPTSSTL